MKNNVVSSRNSGRCSSHLFVQVLLFKVLTGGLNHRWCSIRGAKNNHHRTVECLASNLNTCGFNGSLFRYSYRHFSAAVSADHSPPPPPAPSPLTRPKGPSVSLLTGKEYLQLYLICSFYSLILI